MMQPRPRAPPRRRPKEPEQLHRIATLATEMANTNDVQRQMELKKEHNNLAAGLGVGNIADYGAAVGQLGRLVRSAQKKDEGGATDGK